MTSIDSATMDAVHKLIEERQKYEGWLDGLEKRKATTAPHVFQRVFDDYSARLGEVTVQLSSHADEIRGSLEALSAKVTELMQQESECVDERDEAELRAAVGEYSEEDWTSIKDTFDSQLSGLSSEREKVEAEVSGLQRIIESSQGAGKPKEATTQESIAAAAAVMSSNGPILADADERPADLPHSSDSSEDWGFEESHDPPVPAPQSDGSSSAPTQVETKEVAPSLFANSLAPSAATAGDNRRESEKTLKCPECGTLNYATEWYCERCGGELATF